MMRAFEYVSAATTKQATSLLSANWGQTEILAGGTDLLALMKEDVITPKRLVNIKEIKELAGIDLGATGLRIGALTRLVELPEHPGVRDKYRALAEAVRDAASPQIRNMATLGGNLCQRPRCWYFRNGLGLLPADESGKDLVDAKVGEHLPDTLAARNAGHTGRQQRVAGRMGARPPGRRRRTPGSARPG